VSWECSSQFRRSGQRDERRRRLFAEEAPRTRARRGGPGSSDGDPPDPVPRYSKEAMQQQPRLTDLLPRSLWVHGLLALFGASAIAALISLHDFAASSSPAVDLAGRGSLGDWFVSTALLTAAGLCVIVYSVRRHRSDDYQGRYHIWLWAALGWVLISVDATADLRLWFQQTMVQLTGTDVVGDGTVWWAVPAACLLGAIGSRLLIDMLSDRLSTTLLVSAGGCLALAAAGNIDAIRPTDASQAAMLHGGAWLTGAWLLATSIALHARYVILDAEGLIPLPTPRPKPADDEIDTQRDARLLRLADTDTSEPDDEDESDESEQWVAVASSSKSTQPVLRRRGNRSSSQQAEPESDEQPEPDVESASPVNRKLTKQEKKALKRKLLREQAQRQRDQQRKWAS